MIFIRLLYIFIQVYKQSISKIITTRGNWLTNKAKKLIQILKKRKHTNLCLNMLFEKSCVKRCANH